MPEIEKTDQISVTDSDAPEAKPSEVPAQAAASESPEAKAEGAKTSDVETEQPKPDEGKAAESGGEKRPRKADPQARIDKVTALWRSEQREKEYWKGRAEALEGKSSKAETPPKDATPSQPDDADDADDGEPAVEDYDDLRAWSRAHSAWEASRQQQQSAQQAQEPAANGKDTQAAAPPTLQPTAEQQESYERARAANADFDKVFRSANIELPVEVIIAAHEFPNAPELLYAIAKDGDIERFADLNLRGIKREMQRVVERLIASPDESETPQATATQGQQEQPRPPATERRATRAGPVPPVISGSAPADTPLGRLAETDIASFIARRNAEDRKAGY